LLRGGTTENAAISDHFDRIQPLSEHSFSSQYPERNIA
jgi:hypothetical protein